VSVPPLAAIALALAMPTGAATPATRAAPTFDRPPVSHDDYPAEALRAGQQGLVEVRLAVDARGKVTGCTILRSSGAPSLDATTCTLLQARAGFTPARDAAGRAVADTYDQKIAWRIAGGEARDPRLDAAAQAWVDCLMAEAGRQAGAADSADAVADRVLAACPQGERGLLAAMAVVAPEGAPPPVQLPAGLRAAIRDSVRRRVVQLRAGTP